MTVSESCLSIFRLARVDPQHSLLPLVSSIFYSGPHGIRAHDAPMYVCWYSSVYTPHVAQHEEQNVSTSRIVLFLFEEDTSRAKSPRD